MDQRIAIVTGGTGGIGSAICRRLAPEYRVIAAYFKNGNHEDAKCWQDTQKKAGYEIDISYSDLVSYSDCEALVREVMDQYGRIDVLVNNAGITRDTTFKKMTALQWGQVVEANLTSVFNMTKNVVPTMIQQGHGRIINISSINGRKGQFGQCNYSASKAALFGFSKSLAQEVATKGITVNTISPGYIETPMIKSVKHEIIDQIVANIPVGRLGKPEEVANAVAFLAAPEAGFITGANLDINGGQYM